MRFFMRGPRLLFFTARQESQDERQATTTSSLEDLMSGYELVTDASLPRHFDQKSHDYGARIARFKGTFVT